MNLYWNEKHTEFAVLISPGYGAGWSTWNHDAMAYDKRVVEWFLSAAAKNTTANEREKLFNEWGYDDVYFGGLDHLMLKWVPANAIWRVSEYDGSEEIEYFDEREWNCFPNSEVK